MLGGGVDLENSPIYRATLENIWKYVIKANDAGDYFPLWVKMSFFFSLNQIE